MESEDGATKPSQARAAARFKAWVAPARVRPELWRLALGLLLVASVWMGAVAAVGIATQGAGPRVGILGYLASFAGMILGVGLAARLLHGRSFASLFGPGGLRPRAFTAGAVVVAGIVAATALPAALIDAPERRMDFGAWAIWLPLALPALLIQVSGEELLFRGYLQQQLAARFRGGLVWRMVPAALFGALHWNPALGPNAWLAAAAAGVTGLVYGDVAARAGNLSVSIGLHFANNAFALLVVAVASPLAAFSLYAAPVGSEDVAALRAALIGNMALTAIAYGVYRAVLARRARSLHSENAGSI